MRTDARSEIKNSYLTGSARSSSVRVKERCFERALQEAAESTLKSDKKSPSAACWIRCGLVVVENPLISLRALVETRSSSV